MDPQAAQANASVVNIAMLCLSAAMTVGTLVLWAVASGASKANDLTLSSVCRESISRLKSVISRHKTVFYFTFSLLVLHQIALVSMALKPVTASDDLVKYGLETAIDGMRALSALIIACGELTCQYIILKTNFTDDTASGAAYKYGKKQFGYMLVAQLIANILQMIGQLLLVVPGLILTNILWITSAVSIGEYRLITAISRSFQLAKNHFWDLAKIVMPFSVIVIAGQLLQEVLSFFAAPKAITTITEAAVTVVMFFVAILSWQSQYVLYKYLVKSNGGEQDDTATKISQPQT